MLGQASGLVVYARNLMLIYEKKILPREIIPIATTNSLKFINHSPAPRRPGSDFLNISILVIAGAIILLSQLEDGICGTLMNLVMQVAREMMQTGSYLFPISPVRFILTTLRYFFWLIALLQSRLGCPAVLSAEIRSAMPCLGLFF